jgi:hypothetical protein
MLQFAKRWRVASLLLELEQYQQHPYNLAPEPAVLALVRDLPYLDEEANYNKSLALEPRNAPSVPENVCHCQSP